MLTKKLKPESVNEVLDLITEAIEDTMDAIMDTLDETEEWSYEKSLDNFPILRDAISESAVDGVRARLKILKVN